MLCFLSIGNLYVYNVYTVGLKLACPLAAGKYTAFLREQRCITRSPVRNPMTVKATAVTTTLIERISPVNRMGD